MLLFRSNAIRLRACDHATRPPSSTRISTWTAGAADPSAPAIRAVASDSARTANRIMIHMPYIPDLLLLDGAGLIRPGTPSLRADHQAFPAHVPRSGCALAL